MPSLPSITGKQAIKAFEKDGFSVMRIKGSHHIMKKDGHEYNLAVPVHAKESLKPGALKHLIRSAGMTIDEFLRLI